MKWNYSVTSVIDWAIRISTIASILWCVLSYLNIMPFYQIKLVSVNSVSPTISLLPGTQIRLGIDNHDNSLKGDVASVKWSLIKGLNTFKFDGLEPTITIPPTESGLYVLRVIVTMLDGNIKQGQTGIYVVQDKPIVVTLTKHTQFKLTANELNPVSFSKYSSGNNIEVYSGGGEWTKAKIINSTNEDIIFELKQNQSITTFNSKVIIRLENAPHDLKGYETIQTPSALMKQDHLKNIEINLDQR